MTTRRRYRPSVQVVAERGLARSTSGSCSSAIREIAASRSILPLATRWHAGTPCAPDRSNSCLAEQQLEVLELAQERVVLAVELLVGLSGRLEHREGEGAAAFGQRHDPRREELKRVLAWAGEHVDHTRLAVGVDLEEELA